MGRKKDKTKKQTKQNKSSDSSASSKSKKAGAANTGPIFYFSNKTVTKACKKDKKDIEDACGDEDKKKKDKKGKDKKPNGSEARTQGKLGTLFDKVSGGVDALDTGAKTAYTYPKEPTGDNAWLNKHCKGLWVKPGGGDNIEKFKKELGNIQDKFKGDAIELAKNAGWKVAEKASDKVVSWGEKTLIREGAAILTLEIPIVGEVAVIGATIWSVADGVVATYDIAKMAITEGPRILAEVQGLMGQAEKIGDILKSPTGMNDLMADIMTVTAEANPCVRARKCSLVPYDETKTAAGQAKTGKGCCPGQTGHHLLPDSMFRDPAGEKAGSGRDSKPTLKCWDKYTEGGAPTICLEGTSNNPTNGSHGAAHALTKMAIGPYKTKPTMDYQDARNEMASMVSKTYGCSKDCIVAQLDAYYSKAHSCTGKLNKAQIVPNDGTSGGGGTTTGGTR